VWKVWGRVSSNKTPLSKEEKELKQAEFTVKLMPYLLPLVLALFAYFLVGLIKHPGLERLLGLLRPLGLSLCIISQWRISLARLRGARTSWEGGSALLSVMLVIAGTELEDMYHHPRSLVSLIFDIPVLILITLVVPIFVSIIICETREKRKAGPASR